jgi:5'-deoxynucleotidase
MNSTLRNAGYVRRYHTVQTIGHQTVAEHSFNVAMILLDLTNGKAHADLLKAALYHDLPEVFTGDIPATAKWASPTLVNSLKLLEDVFDEHHDLRVNLSEDDKRLLKFADMVELVMYSLDQLRLGNRNMLDIAERGVCYLEEMQYVSQPALSMMNDLINQVEKFK